MVNAISSLPKKEKRKKKKDEEHVNKEIISQNEEHDNNIDWDVVSPNDKYDKKKYFGLYVIYYNF